MHEKEYIALIIAVGKHLMNMKKANFRLKLIQKKAEHKQKKIGSLKYHGAIRSKKPENPFYLGFSREVSEWICY